MMECFVVQIQRVLPEMCKHLIHCVDDGSTLISIRT